MDLDEFSREALGDLETLAVSTPKYFVLSFPFVGLKEILETYGSNMEFKRLPEFVENPLKFSVLQRKQYPDIPKVKLAKIEDDTKGIIERWKESLSSGRLVGEGKEHMVYVLDSEKHVGLIRSLYARRDPSNAELKARLLAYRINYAHLLQTLNSGLEHADKSLGNVGYL